MAGVEVMSVTWDSHHKSVISVFDSLLKTETLVDCTLAAEGKFIKVHKIIISACSPYLKSLLVGASDSHPILILNDTRYSDLESLVEYMYKGGVMLPKERVKEFKLAAEHLQIRGLFDPKQTQLLKEGDRRERRRNRGLKRTRPATDSYERYDDEAVNLKTELFSEEETTVASDDDPDWEPEPSTSSRVEEEANFENSDGGCGELVIKVKKQKKVRKEEIKELLTRSIPEGVKDMMAEKMMNSINRVQSSSGVADREGREEVYIMSVRARGGVAKTSELRIDSGVTRINKKPRPKGEGEKQRKAHEGEASLRKSPSGEGPREKATPFPESGGAPLPESARSEAGPREGGGPLEARAPKSPPPKKPRSHSEENPSKHRKTSASKSSGTPRPDKGAPPEESIFKVLKTSKTIEGPKNGDGVGKKQEGKRAASVEGVNKKSKINPKQDLRGYFTLNRVKSVERNPAPDLLGNTKGYRLPSSRLETVGGENPTAPKSSENKSGASLKFPVLTELPDDGAHWLTEEFDQTDEIPLVANVKTEPGNGEIDSQPSLQTKNDSGGLKAALSAESVRGREEGKKKHSGSPTKFFPTSFPKILLKTDKSKVVKRLKNNSDSGKPREGSAGRGAAGQAADGRREPGGVRETELAGGGAPGPPLVATSREDLNGEKTQTENRAPIGPPRAQSNRDLPEDTREKMVAQLTSLPRVPLKRLSL